METLPSFSYLAPKVESMQVACQEPRTAHTPIMQHACILPTNSFNVQGAWTVLCSPSQATSILEAFSKIQWSGGESWPEATLSPIVFYLRRSKLIDLPREFKALIPASGEVLEQSL